MVVYTKIEWKCQWFNLVGIFLVKDNGWKVE